MGKELFQKNICDPPELRIPIFIPGDNAKNSKIGKKREFPNGGWDGNFRAIPGQFQGEISLKNMGVYLFSGKENTFILSFNRPGYFDDLGKW